MKSQKAEGAEMKRRIKWHKFKRRARKIILLTFVEVAFLFGFCSLVYLIETTGMALFTCVLCWTFIALFIAANKKVLF